MNQILSTSIPTNNRKAKNRNPVQIGSVLKFFAIVLVIFGVFMLGIGAYSIYKNQTAEQNKKIEPTISIENKTDTTILLKVTHKKNISKLEYGWNDEEKETINGNGGKYLEREITIPSGTNTLHVIVTAEDGQETTYDKQYEIESNINIEVSGNKIKITDQSDTPLSYMTYRWDEEEETRIELNNETNIEQEIEAIKGLHTLTVIVVDENNNSDTKTQKINGVSKPKIVLDVDAQKEHFVIKAFDDEKIDKIVFKLNQDDSQSYELNLGDKNLKELDYSVPFELQNGENIIEVTVYNSNGVSEESGVRFVKQ